MTGEKKIKQFTHLKDGTPQMVDVTDKRDVDRAALASGRTFLTGQTMDAIRNDNVSKGNVFEVARIACILAVKSTPQVIPMCHNIPLTGIDVSFETGSEWIEVSVKVKSIGKTGVEMEALHGVSTSLLTIWDMVKSMEKDETGNYPKTEISGIRVIEKNKGEME